MIGDVYHVYQILPATVGCSLQKMVDTSVLSLKSVDSCWLPSWRVGLSPFEIFRSANRNQQGWDAVSTEYKPWLWGVGPGLFCEVFFGFHDSWNTKWNCDASCDVTKFSKKAAWISGRIWVNDCFHRFVKHGWTWLDPIFPCWTLPKNIKHMQHG